ncbi:glycosyl hydrolase [Mycobacteroides abscessus]|uniref:glycosyl hydrolase n=1 Tax=Mycobacteroides abscessus TaxID=36809 RepID=UPI0009CDD53B|nr:glycosyl hydrolase [Mycobacteroides abscessus]SKQ79908.1 Glycosyl hydrolases family 2, sugar binding domain [Mycobacteroides abscessus subsp. massiliense]
MMKRRTFLWGVAFAGLEVGPIAACGRGLLPGTTAQALLEQFAVPPATARPLVWWHWLNGAITPEGLGLDLEWMQRAGIGGVQIFNGAVPNNNGHIRPPVTFLSPEWRRAFAGAVTQANEADISVGVATSAGWSQTGAPFVKTADAMKKLVWSETEVVGGGRIRIVLPQPPSVAGPFGTVPAEEAVTIAGEKLTELPDFYADSRVIAYRVPAGEPTLPLPTVTTASGPIDAAPLFDGRLEPAVHLPQPTHEAPVWLRFDYAQPVTVRSVTAALAPVAPPVTGATPIPARIEVSDDGKSYRRVGPLAVGAFPQNTTSFPAITGRSFRIVLQPDAPSGPPASLAGMAPGALLQPGLPTQEPSETIPLSQMALGASPRVNRFEEKAGFSSVLDYYAIPTPPIDGDFAVDPGQVVDVTAHMQADGRLDWTPPNGAWRVLRIGYSLTGHRNGPAEAAATGLEVDKLSAPRVRAYMERYLDLVLSAAGGGQVSSILSDSIEAGFSNWTEDILEQFEKRRGYDPTPMLPALTGRVVGSAEASDGFLYDFRRTISDLLAEAHYGAIADVAHDRGLTVCGEAIESGSRPILGDDIAMRRHTDVPMGAMWTYAVDAQPNPSHVADIKGAASTAHLYGATHVGAESMSSMLQPWAASPRELKHVIDTQIALGVNRPSIHSSVHQPFSDRAPGLALWIFGQYFNRHESWAEQARAWTDYIARLSSMMSQGQYQADVAYFYGEEAPLVTLAQDGRLDDLPTRHGYDFVNADALLSEFTVEDGALITRSGMRYRVLQLGGTSQQMTLAVLRRICELVSQGATVIGEKPTGTPSYGDHQGEFTRLAAKVWSGGQAAGRVITASDGDTTLADMGVVPELDVVGGGSAHMLRFQHRVSDGTHLWFLANSTGRPQSLEVALRVTGMAPELWDAETGATRDLSYRTDGETTIIPITFADNGSALIVFRQPTDTTARTIDEPTTPTVTPIEGSWTVTFQTGRGAPPAAVQLATGSLTEHPDPQIRYFSGTATYAKTVHLSVPEGQRIYLSLGAAADIAEVTINGQLIQTIWHEPYRADITNAVTSGPNNVQVKVTNRWVNRLIGDAQPENPKVTWTVAPVYDPDAPLLPAGLIGPVTIEVQ